MWNKLRMVIVLWFIAGAAAGAGLFIGFAMHLIAAGAGLLFASAIIMYAGSSIIEELRCYLTH